MKKFTIFTPTYNRSNYLKILYNSIINQTLFLNDIVWLIVDDGSSDETRDVVDGFIKENKIEIRYEFKNNGGKYKAINYAIKIIDTPYFACIDSDDYLMDNSLKYVFEYISLNDDSIGAIFPYLNNRKDSEEFDDISNKLVNVSDIKFIYNYNIETTIIFKTKVIKEYSFPENDEKFQSEEILYNMLIDKGKFVFINKFIASGEYLDTGLTRNIYKLWYDNFENTISLFSSRYKYLKNNMNFGFKKMKEKCKCIINKNSICMAKKNGFYKYSDNKFLSTILYFPSLLYKYFKYDRRGLKL